MTCSHCGTDISNPHTCSYCDREFCDEHRLPENHGCPFQAQATRPTSSKPVQEESSVDAPEPLDLESSRAESTRSSSSSPPSSKSPEVRLSQSEEDSTPDDDDSARGFDVEVAKIRIGGIIRNVVRLVGLLAVVAGLYHLFVPFVDPTLPTWAPWRVFGLTANAGSGAIYHIGDVILMGVGAVIAWFV